MIRTHAPAAFRPRGLGGPVILAAMLLAGIGAIAFVAQRPVETAIPPQRVAVLAEITETPKEIQIVMARGLDRLIQRREQAGTCPGMGCPGSTPLRPTPIFVLRDQNGVIHAFIGDDPRNGCPLEWLKLPDRNWSVDGVVIDAVFHDTCHGSLYGRRGEIMGGPAYWELNQLAVEVRGQDVYVHPSQILVGKCRDCD